MMSLQGQGQRILAYTTPSPDGMNVVVDVQGMMVDLVTFLKAMAIQMVVPEEEAKEHFMVAVEEVWKNVEVSPATGVVKQ
jgi:hypothetical protein